MTSTVTLTAPASMTPGSTVRLPDGSVTTIGSDSTVAVSALFVSQLLNAGFTYAAAAATQTSQAQSVGTSAGLADSQSRSDAVSAGLADSQSRSSATSAGLADSMSRSEAISAGTSASVARSSITSGTV